NWEKQRPLMPYALAIASVTQIFFLGISLFVENPFATLDVVPADGNGLNPLLRHPGMIIHPPMLYLGFTGFIIPYTFAMAALISGKLDDSWIKVTRRWTLFAWLFLGLGLVLGGRWAYDVLGWGGYWAWDPVENASLLPWLAATPFLHSVIIQEKQGMFKRWNMILILLTYLLVIYGTFIVRSGVISSVHAFAQSAIGPLFFGFMSIMTIFSLVWLFIRWNELGSKNQLRSLLSRESAFLLNNFIFLAILGVTAWGTNYPIVSELFTNEQATVGAVWYEKITGPLFAALLLLMGVAPLTMWFKTSLKRLEMGMRMPALITSTISLILFFAYDIRDWVAVLGYWIVTFATILTLLEFWKGTRARMKRGENAFTALNNLIVRNRRRYGGYSIHLGILIMGFGIIGSNVYQQETQIRLKKGQSISLGDFDMTFNGVREYAGPDDLVVREANVDVYKKDRLVNTLTPRVELYTRTNQPMTIPDAHSTIGEDFYVLMVNWEGVSTTEATFRIYINPLINWVWAGGLIFFLGTLIAAWRDPAPSTVVIPKRLTTVLGVSTD
ncbi:MAG: heme lyase CcmF/NrfE family subunit, partial [Methylococcales bacterium]|nr:heme lyase CcmF/NrfE family subunit [Methylococcales bacterium]